MVREISIEEVKKHRDSKSVWIVIHNDVYDVTNFLEEHPGGEDSLLEVAGQDGTQSFEDVGHSADARALLEKYMIGTLPQGEIMNNVADTEIRLKLKWAILALAGAILVGVVLHRHLRR
ncbi:unnamed protein product [Parnassius apollo]|uniref:Cytochrome b5 n=1 Tax=Parnassius apollo TaxID=110799 RepID=A0A8S3XV94_PARAO|nr:unnamed protein product [Parnassius apollo]